MIKGAIIAYNSQFLGRRPNVILFQYNPGEVSRSLENRTAPSDVRNVGAAKEEATRVLGPPVETISVTVELDAAEQLEHPLLHPHVARHGLHPALAALEMLLYPPPTQVHLNRALAQAGTVQYCPPEVPLALFVWGVSRVLPVRLSSFSVTEEAHDRNLNPIRARVELSMRVLTYMELKESSIGYQAYMATQVQKEVLARLNVANSAREILGLLPI